MRIKQNLQTQVIMGFTSEKGKFFVILGVFLLIASIAGVVFVAIEKNEYLFHETRDNIRSIESSLLLEGNHTYEIVFGAEDESTEYDAIVGLRFILYIDGDEVMNSRL
ncbi:MAG: hypothetical protein RTU92_15025 [Candidatus Thorarchaeota archaeon]